MFSVEPTLARMFFRSGAEALAVGGRLSLGAEELGRADAGFLSAAVPGGRGGVAVGLTRPGAALAGEAAPGPLALLLAALLEVLLGRLKSAAKAGVRQQGSGGDSKREPRGRGGGGGLGQGSTTWGWAVTWRRLCNCLLDVHGFALGLDACTNRVSDVFLNKPAYGMSHPILRFIHSFDNC